MPVHSIRMWIADSAAALALAPPPSPALFSYVLLTVSMTCYLGVQTGNLINLWLGVQIPWWLISGLMIVIVGLLGYRHIELSAKVLGVVLVLEVITVITIDVGVLASGRELTLIPFSPTEALSGVPGLGLLFAFLGFFGFEATAVFRNEAKDPERTIPEPRTLPSSSSVRFISYPHGW